MAGFTEIPPSALMRLIGTPDAPIVIDVCIPEDFAEDPRVIPTARRISHKKILDHLPELQGYKTVVTCQKGLKLSHGTAALLRHHGVSAEVLEGGMYGWRDADMPMVPFAQIPESEAGSTLWVTRHRPKIDRIACPWLIRRFVDPSAQFLFVPPSEVAGVAEKFGATAFDVEGGDLGHQGDQCTFDTMLDRFALQTQALLDLAKIIRAADTGKPDASPQAAGLLAMSVGLSRLHKDDTSQLNAGMALYDALYRWARDGQTETHGTDKHHGA